ncbi:MAG: hypothetical protein PWP48_645 [Clostridiales bacterium]|nr:hypothetical protein [Clostridiales bacterium]
MYRLSTMRNLFCFNPRPRTRGDSGGNTQVIHKYLVSIHAPARGATKTSREKFICCQSFNPRPRTRGDLMRFRQPTLGQRFNPRPRTRGDLLRAMRTRHYISFNPRPRTRGDPILAAMRQVWIVSIHAPARGATVAAC